MSTANEASNRRYRKSQIAEMASGRTYSPYGGRPLDKEGPQTVPWGGQEATRKMGRRYCESYICDSCTYTPSLSYSFVTSLRVDNDYIAHAFRTQLGRVTIL